MKKSTVKSKWSLKELLSVYPVTAFAIAVSVVLCFVTFFYNYKVALCELLLIAILLILAVVLKNLQFKRLLSQIDACEGVLSTEKSGGLEKFPISTVIYSKDDKIIWFNSAFKKKVVGAKAPQTDSIMQFTSGLNAEQIREKDSFECEYADKCFTVYSSLIEYKKETLYALYFVEDTELKGFRLKYKNARPVVLFMTVDTSEENFRNLRESQISEIVSGVEGIIENWFSKFDCLVKKLGNGRFVIITDYENSQKMKQEKFSVLSQVRNYTYNGNTTGITLSVGASGGETINDCEISARQALDMALGRGGDQVAYKNGNNDYEFFGGVSQTSEKRTKVRARIVASAITQIILRADNVVIMGHKNSDLDAIGAATGVAKICMSLGKECRIITDTETTLALPLIEHLKGSEFEYIIVTPSEAKQFLTNNTLLVVVDTHRKSFLEAPEIFDLASTVIVIDHHRKTVDHITNAVIFYHEPNSSSASEMVTELIEYMGERVNLSKVLAESLLSGIMLDTKNFVMRTGVATFEAAAFLRSQGADTVSVKQLFANSLATEKEKSEIVKNAVILEGSAIGVVDFESDNVRVIAGQSADELLNCSGVEASFVLFKANNSINISARSYGALNVQLVMEKLGGGGHRTMAACQLTDTTFEDALNELKNAIKEIKSLNE